MLRSQLQRPTVGKWEKMKLLRSCRRLLSGSASSASSVPAFVFDIDGVLVRGKQPIPAGRQALEALFDESRGDFRYPVMFLTNGGGMNEEDKAKEVTKKTGIPVSADHVVLSHTPMRELAKKYNKFKDSVVVSVGKRRCVQVARNYGFERVISIDDFARNHPVTAPNTSLEPADEPVNEELANMNVAAILLMHDSRNWGADIQLICDILGSDGSPVRQPHPEQVVPMYASNLDFLFVNEYEHPRFAQGAFLTALEAIFLRRFGRPVQYTKFGKPQKVQYDFIEPILNQRAKNLGFKDIASVYMIGDNPEADVRGANGAGGKWVSVLVRTGCFTGGENDPNDPAHLVVNDAHEAIQTALQRHTLAA